MLAGRGVFKDANGAIKPAPEVGPHGCARLEATSKQDSQYSVHAMTTSLSAADNFQAVNLYLGRFSMRDGPFAANL